MLAHTPSFRIAVNDITGMQGDATEAMLMDLRRQRVRRSYEPHQWPLFSVGVTHIREHQHRVHIYFDLLMVQGLSVSILFSETQHLYDHPQAELSPLRPSLNAVLDAASAGKGGAAYEASKRYWLARIPHLPPMPELPWRRTPAGRFERHTGHLEPPAWRALKKNAAETGLTPAMALCAAYAEIICLWSRQPHFLLNIMFSNRDRSFGSEIDNIVGNFSSISLREVNRDCAGSFEQRARALQFFSKEEKEFFQRLPEHREPGIFSRVGPPRRPMSRCAVTVWRRSWIGGRCRALKIGERITGDWGIFAADGARRPLHLLHPRVDYIAALVVEGRRRS